MRGIRSGCRRCEEDFVSTYLDDADFCYPCLRFYRVVVVVCVGAFGEARRLCVILGRGHAPDSASTVFRTVRSQSRMDISRSSARHLIGAISARVTRKYSREEGGVAVPRVACPMGPRFLEPVSWPRREGCVWDVSHGTRYIVCW